MIFRIYIGFQVSWNVEIYFISITTMIKVKRIYEKPHKDDGYRVLVDKLWPRGVGKHEARLDEWFRSIAPSNGLRKWFNHDPDKWEEFKNRYRKELENNLQEVSACQDKLRGKDRITFLFSSKELMNNHAHFLKNYFEELGW